MSFGPAHDTKEQVRQATDIVDLVGSYITLRRQGRGFVALCPWHDDARPSLQINQDRQTWKCWVCDIGGDAFSFVMQREGVDFREALQILADRAGIDLKASGGAKSVPGSAQDKQTLYRVCAWAEQQFHQCLLHAAEAAPARKYLSGRGITDASIERFHLGFAPDDWQWLIGRAKNTPFSPEVLLTAGLIGKTDPGGRLYDRFKGRVIFPIRDTQPRAIAFGGRVLPELAKADEAARGRPPAKYINSPETRLFSKSDHLYGLDVVWSAVTKSRHVVVVEGYTDVVMASQTGLDNVTAVLGTALNERHLRLLRRFADRVTLVLDGDEAGQRRTNEILELFVAADFDLRVLTLPEGLDPCDFLLERGAEPFRELLATAVDALEHKVAVESRGLDPSRDTARANHALENILATIAKAPTTQNVAASAGRLREQQILTRLARRFLVGEAELRARLKDLRTRTGTRSASDAATPASSAPKLNELDAKVAELLEILAQHPELATDAIAAIPAPWLPAGAGREIYAVYHWLRTQDESMDFQRVLSELEDPQLKNLLVQLDERAAAKAEQVQQDAPSRLQGLIRDFQQRQTEQQRRARMAALEDRSFDEKEELNVLQQLIEQERSRQGISAPTDG